MIIALNFSTQPLTLQCLVYNHMISRYGSMLLFLGPHRILNKSALPYPSLHMIKHHDQISIILLASLTTMCYLHRWSNQWLIPFIDYINYLINSSMPSISSTNTQQPLIDCGKIIYMTFVHQNKNSPAILVIIQ